MNLTEHFTLEELTHTNTGIPNEPGVLELANLGRLANALEYVRELIGCRLKINSGYRCAEVNKRVGGVPASQHTRGEAADFVPLDGDLDAAVALIRMSDVPYDQLIREPSWIHLSIAPNGQGPRKQVLRATKTPTGKMRYDAM